MKGKLASYRMSTHVFITNLSVQVLPPPPPNVPQKYVHYKTIKKIRSKYYVIFISKESICILLHHTVIFSEFQYIFLVPPPPPKMSVIFSYYKIMQKSGKC